LMIGTAANRGRDNLDFRRGSTVMVGHLKRSRNVGSGASQHWHAVGLHVSYGAAHSHI
jgi:hypothetical protein